jgi:hypothetical protein
MMEAEMERAAGTRAGAVMADMTTITTTARGAA